MVTSSWRRGTNSQVKIPYILICKSLLILFIYDGYKFAKLFFTGRFFGEVHGEILEQLVNHDIYKRVHVVDYQAICFHLFSKSGFGMILQNVRN